MNALRMVILAGLVACGATSRADEIVVADGDTDGLMEALGAVLLVADEPQPRVISLAPRGRYEFTEDTAGAAIYGDVQLLGNGAVWTGHTANQRIFIRSKAKLEITSLTVRNMTLGLEGTPSFRAGFAQVLIPAAPGAPWIENHGNLKISDSSFAHITIENKEFGLVAGLIESSGGISMENVTVNELHYKATSGIDISTSLLLTSELDANLRNLTITGSKGAVPAILDATACDANISCSFRLTNSIAVKNNVPLCQGSVTSLGDNILDEPACGAMHASDRIVKSFDLLPFTTRLGPVGVLPVVDNSPAIDAGGQGRCPQHDAVGTSRNSDGDGDGIGSCDIGAWEFPAELRAGPGILSGLFFQSVADGHYVQLQETAPGRYVVFWSTFDQDGNPAWILATGQRSGTTIHADAFISQGGHLKKGGAPTGQQIEPWGSVEVEIKSCAEGTFRYDSTRPEFGSGEFKLTRLAFVHELGCR